MRRSFRGATRRQRREHAWTEDGEEVGSPETLLARMQAERRVAALLLEHDEPFKQRIRQRE